MKTIKLTTDNGLLTKASVKSIPSIDDAVIFDMGEVESLESGAIETVLRSFKVLEFTNLAPELSKVVGDLILELSCPAK